MVDKATSTRIICEGGLDSSQNYLYLSSQKPGAATRLVNYEVGLSGGYRRINGYAPYDATYGEVTSVANVAQGKVLGLIQFENSTTGATEVYAMRRLTAAPTEYGVYKYESGTGWVLVVTGLTHLYSSGGAEVDKIRWDQGNDGTSNYLAFVDGVNNATLFDGTTWVFIDSADSGLDLANAGGPNALNAPSLVGFFENHLWLAKDTINNFTGIMAHSAPNAFYDWLTASGSGQVVAGHIIVGFKSFRDSLYVFGSNAIKRIFVEGTDFVIKDVTQNIGLTNPDALIEIGGSLIFLAQDGFRPIAGTDKIDDIQLETISKQVHTLIQRRLVDTAGINMNAVAIRGKSQFRVFFGDDGADAAASKGIIGALRTPDQQSGWEFGELLGIRASVCSSRYVNGVEEVLHGDFDGYVYQQESGNDLNGADMLSVYSTPYLDFDDTEIRKTMQDLTVFALGEGSLDINLNVSYDWGKTTTSNPSNYTLELDANQPIYDDALFMYDDPGAVYGGLLTPIGTKNIEGSFFSARFTFSASGSEAPHTIHALVVEFKNEGRR